MKAPTQNEAPILGLLPFTLRKRLKVPVKGKDEI